MGPAHTAGAGQPGEDELHGAQEAVSQGPVEESPHALLGVLCTAAPAAGHATGESLLPATDTSIILTRVPLFLCLLC